MNRSRPAFAVGVVVAVLLLGGCSDDDPQPKIAPPESTSPASTVSSSPTGPVEPTMPAAASQNDGPGEKAFVDYWFSLLSFSMSSGDTAGITRTSHRECVSCSALIRKIDDLYGKGGRIETKGWKVEAATDAPDSRPDAPAFLLRVRQTKRTLIGADGAVVDETPFAKVPMRIRLSTGSDGWTVRSLEILR